MFRREAEKSVRMYQARVHMGDRRGGAFLLPLLALLLIGCLSALTFVWLNSQQDHMGRQIRETRKQIALRSKELENLRVEVESYKRGRYIHRAVSQLGLELREPLPGQVHRVDEELKERSPEWLQDSMVAKK